MIPSPPPPSSYISLKLINRTTGGQPMRFFIYATNKKLVTFLFWIAKKQIISKNAPMFKKNCLISSPPTISI